MSHIHIPDGVLPLWLVVLGWVGAIALVALAVNRSAKLDLRKRVPLIGAVAALMLVGMSSEIIPIAYHVNLSIIAGILLGPWLSIVTALVVNSILGLIGHGGVTVIGLNTLVISTEMIAGWALFHAIIGALGRTRATWSAGIAAFLALAISTTALIGLVALGGSPAATRESGALDPATLSFENPFAEGVFLNALFSDDGHGHGDEDEHHDEDEDTHDEEYGEGAVDPHDEGGLSIGRFATVVYTLGSIGWVLEALLTAAIIGFVARVRPRLVFEGAPADSSRPPLGDEGLHR